MTLTDLPTATPVEIDTRINQLDYQHGMLVNRAEIALIRWARTADGDRPAARASYLAACRLVIDNRMERQRLENEHTRRGWSRAYVVPGGHVHAEGDCHTLQPTTQLYLAAVVSGADEARVVEAAGERACTHCYPSAPVEALNRTSIVFTPDEEEAEKTRAEKAARAAAKDAARLTVHLPDRPAPTTFTSVRAARTEALSEYGWALYSVAYNGPGEIPQARAAANIARARRRMANVEVLAAAIAEREGVDADAVRTELAGKAQAKFKREAKPGMDKTLTAQQKTAKANDMVLAALAVIAHHVA